MKRMPCLLALFIALGVLPMWTVRAIGADEAVKAAGTWEMTSESPRGPRTQTVTIQQDGATINGILEGRRGAAPVEGSVTGNKISFTVKRETPNGTFTLEYTGTIDGDSMKGNVHSEMFDAEWTAKRSGGGDK